MAFENLETVDGFARPRELRHVDELVVVARAHHHHVRPARHLHARRGMRVGAEAEIRSGRHESVRARGRGCEKRKEQGRYGCEIQKKRN